MEQHSDKETLDLLVERYRRLTAEMGKVIVGQQEAVESLLTAVFSDGHCLLVGVPGLAKTLMVNTLAKTLGLTFNRIQFTPDLMPSDITGSEILDQNREFRFMRGPVFANIVLADEINRGRTARSDAGAFGHRGRQVLQAYATLLCPRHTKPHRAGGNLSPTRSPVGPFYVQRKARLSQL